MLAVRPSAVHILLPQRGTDTEPSPGFTAEIRHHHAGWNRTPPGAAALPLFTDPAMLALLFHLPGRGAISMPPIL